MTGAYYGWWVLAATFTLAAFSAGIFGHSNGVFFGPIKKDLGLNNTQTSLLFSLTRAEGSITGPIFGRLVDRFGARPMILAGGLTASAGFIILHWIHSYWPFVLILVGIVATGKSSGLGHTLLSAVNRWFIGRRSLAISIQMTGFSLGGAAVLPFIVLGVHSIGWRDVMLYSGIFMAIIVIPLAMFVRHSPERMGIEPEGMHLVRRREAIIGLTQTTSPISLDFTVSEALRTRTFWVMLAASVIRISIWGAISVHAVQIIQWKGIDEQAAGFMFSLMFLLSIPMTLSAGLLGMRFPPQPLLAMGTAGIGLGMLALVLLDGQPAVYIFVVLMAIGEGTGSLNWVALGDFFGRRSFATLFGIMSACFNIGLLGTPIYAGWIRDTHNESYSLVLLTFAPLYGICALLFLLMRKPPTPVLSTGEVSRERPARGI